MSRSRASPIPLLKIKIQEKGRIKDIKQMIVHVDGLRTCLNGQIVDMGDGVSGIIMGFDESDVLVLVLGDPGRLRMGKEITAVSEPFQIAVGEACIGRMLDALGRPIDSGGPVETQSMLPVMRQSQPITHRAPVDEYLPTGTKFVDTIIPLAKGQRQLILGDRMTGKTSVALDAILNQKGRDCICIYCCIGQSVSSLEKVASLLHARDAFEYCIIMAATDNAPVGEQYLVPFASASLAEYFAGRGRDVLVVFDDLTKHAWSYRQLSLLLERSPGREAYPGDIFYVQTQLMERAGRFNDRGGGGTVTFLAIAETLQGDLTGYIPSNLASMCDGQIILSSSIFADGVRPAIDLQLSLSIIGGRVHPPALRALSTGLRADFARYTEIMRLSRLQSTVSEQARHTMAKGRAILALLQQGQGEPVSLSEEILLLFSMREERVLELADRDLLAFRAGISEFAREEDPGLLDRLEKQPVLDEPARAGLSSLITAFLDREFGPADAAAAPAGKAGEDGA